VWLAERSRNERWTAERKQRWRSIRAAARLLRAMHEASCYLKTPRGTEHGPGWQGTGPLLLQLRAGGVPAVVLRGPEDVRPRSRASRNRERRDLRTLWCWLGCAACSRTDQLRFLLRYLGLPRLTPAAKRLARTVLDQARETIRRAA
jgi:hypothetical protein